MVAAQGQLPSWSGNPFDPQNRDAVFNDGDLLCIVAPSREMEGVLIVDQFDRELLKEGNQVEIMFDAAKLASVHGRITEFSLAEVKDTSAIHSTSTGGTLDTKTDETGRIIPISTSYQARVIFDSHEIQLKPGYRGKSNVYLSWRSLSWRAYRYIMKTFNFRFLG